MVNLFKKYLTQRVRNIISIIIIVFGLVYIINYSFYKPTYINKYIAKNIYKVPANSAFTDQNFYNCVIDAYNNVNKTSLGYTENLTNEQLLTITDLSCNEKEITSIVGIEKMTELVSLSVKKNQLTSVNVSKNINLQNLNFYENKLTSLDISNNLELKYLFVGGNRELSELNLSNNTKLIELNVSVTNINSLNLLKNLNIKKLNISSSNLSLENVSIGNYDNVTDLTMYATYLTNEQLNNFKNLVYLNISSRAEKISSLDLSRLTELEFFYLGNAWNIKHINLKNNIKLINLQLIDNYIEDIDLTSNVNLFSLDFRETKISTLDLSKNIALRTLHLSTSNKLEKLNISNTHINNIKLDKINKLKELYAENCKYLNTIDLTSNTYLSVIKLGNNKITELDLSNNTKLTNLSINDNELSNIDLTNNTLLVTLNVANNKLTTLDLSKNIVLENLNISNNNIANLSLNKNVSLSTLIAENNKLSSIDLSNNNLLVTLDLFANKFNSINLASNNQLKNLNLFDNNFSNVLTKYVGDSGNAKSSVKLPSHLEQGVIWTSNDENIAISTNDGVVTAIGPGTVDVIGINKYYSTKTIINVFEMTSNKYNVDNDSLYIYIGSDNDINTIKNNLNLPDYIMPVFDFEANKIKLTKNDVTIKEFEIVRLESDKYIIGDEFIYTGFMTNMDDLICYGCTASIKNNNVIIKHNNKDVYSLKMIYFDIYKYVWMLDSLSHEGEVFVGLDSDLMIMNNINIINGSKMIVDGYLKYYYNDIELAKFSISRIVSKYKEIADKTILYTGFTKFSCDNILYDGNIGGKYEENSNTFTVYETKEFAENTILTNKIKTYDILTLGGKNINIKGNNLLTEDIDYNRFISNLIPIDNISYNVMYNNVEVTGGEVNPGSVLNVYYKNELIDRYYINRNSNFNISDDIAILNDEIIYGLDSEYMSDDLFSKIDTDGVISLLDNAGNVVNNNSIIKTGYILRLTFDNDLNNPIDYKLSVRGDVLGTGVLSRENAKKIARHIVNKNIISGQEYLLAADYDNDGKIKMNDVIKMLRDKKKRENS